MLLDNTFVMLRRGFTISYQRLVQGQIAALPDTVAARYVVLTRRMVAFGPNLGEPHTKAFGDGLFELRLKGAEGLGRVFFCTLVGRRIVMLHSFMKKSDKTPKRELDTARIRMRRSNMQTHSQLVKRSCAARVCGRKWRVSNTKKARFWMPCLRHDNKLALRKRRSPAHGHQAPAVARLERSLATGKHSPSIATLRSSRHAVSA